MQRQAAQPQVTIRYIKEENSMQSKVVITFDKSVPDAIKNEIKELIQNADTGIRGPHEPLQLDSISPTLLEVLNQIQSICSRKKLTIQYHDTLETEIQKGLNKVIDWIEKNEDKETPLRLQVLIGLKKRLQEKPKNEAEAITSYLKNYPFERDGFINFKKGSWVNKNSIVVWLQGLKINVNEIGQHHLEKEQRQARERAGQKRRP